MIEEWKVRPIRPPHGATSEEKSPLREVLPRLPSSGVNHWLGTGVRTVQADAPQAQKNVGLGGAAEAPEGGARGKASSTGVASAAAAGRPPSPTKMNLAGGQTNPQAGAVSPQQGGSGSASIAVGASLVAGPSQQTYEEMRARAEEAGLDAAKTKVGLVTEKYFDAIADLQTTVRAMRESYERNVVEVAMMVAREILRRELTIDGDGLATRLEEALEASSPLADRPSATVRLGEGEMEHIRRCRPDLLVNGAEFVVDERLGAGGCLIEARDRVTDVSIEPSLERVRRALLEVGVLGSLDPNLESSLSLSLVSQGPALQGAPDLQGSGGADS